MEAILRRKIQRQGELFQNRASWQREHSVDLSVFNAGNFTATKC